MRGTIYREDEEKAKQWEREHGAAFYRSIYPYGIPRETLESFGLWVPDATTPEAPTAHAQSRASAL